MSKLTDVRYSLMDSPNKNFIEVSVIYSLDGKYHRYFIFLNKVNSWNEKDYINKAKKQFSDEYKSGKVTKASKPDNSKSWLVAGATVFGAAAIALAGLFTWKYLTGGNGGGGTYQPGQPVEAKPVVEDPSGGNYIVTFSNDKAKVGEKYHTSINLTPKNPTNDDYVLPDKLVSVISNTTALKEEQYKYKLAENKTTAELEVEGEFVYGPVTVSLVLVSTSQPGPGPEPGVWVKTDQNGVLVNRDQILTVTKTQSPMYLIPQVLNGQQFIVEEKVDMTYVYPNDGSYVTRYYIDTDSMYIKSESENLETHKKTTTYLAYRENTIEGYGVYYCYEDPDDDYKKTHILDYIASTGVETAKNKFNYSYLDEYYPDSSALSFVRNIFHTYPYDYRYDDETGIMIDGLKDGIADYIESWAVAAPSETVEMDYQKMDYTSIKVSNEKTAPATLESMPCTLSTKYNLLIENGLLLNYANNMTVVVPDYVTMSMIEEFSIKTCTFELDNLDEYFAD